jgi:hypothetical protein
MDALSLAIEDILEPTEKPKWRELTEDEIESLSSVRGTQKSIPTTTRLRERHHSLARALASGMPDYEAAAITGYSASRISVLKSDPAFRDLLHFYRGKKDAQYEDMHKRLAGLSIDAVDELRDRFEEDPKQFTPGQLLEMTKVGADRTGFGPQTNANVNVNIDMSARLRAARERAINHEARKMIDVTPEKSEG